MMESFETITTGNQELSRIAITPRLRYSLSLIDEVIEITEDELQKLHAGNKNFVSCSERIISSNLENERTLFLTCLSLIELKKRIKGIQGVYEVPKTLLLSVPLIRYLSSSLFNQIPICSQKLNELSVSLGSLILDSAIISGASVDLRTATRQSSEFIDEVKLMVNSKINKLYPNLEIKKPDNT